MHSVRQILSQPAWLSFGLVVLLLMRDFSAWKGPAARDDGCIELLPKGCVPRWIKGSRFGPGPFGEPLLVQGAGVCLVTDPLQVRPICEYRNTSNWYDAWDVYRFINSLD